MNATQELIPDITRTSQQLAARLPSNLTDTQLAEVLNAGLVFDSYLAQARAEAEKRIKAGTPIDGWEIVPTEGKRAIVDPVKAYNRMQPLLEPHIILSCARFSIGALTLAVKNEEGISEAKAKDIIAEYLNGNIVKGPGGEKLQLAPKRIEVPRPPMAEKLDKLPEGRANEELLRYTQEDTE